MNVLKIVLLSLIILSCSEDSLKDGAASDSEHSNPEHQREISVQFWEAPGTSEMAANDNSIGLSLTPIRTSAVAAIPSAGAAIDPTAVRPASPGRRSVRAGAAPHLPIPANPQAPVPVAAAAGTVGRQIGASIAAAIRRPSADVEISDIYRSIQRQGQQMGALSTAWHHGPQVERTQSYGGGGQNAGVHRIVIPGVGPMVVRFEVFKRSQTKAERDGHKLTLGHNFFAQSSARQVFKASPTAPLMEGQYMDSGGDDLMEGPPLSLNAALDVLRVASHLNQNGAINLDAKARNFVRTPTRDGAMAIDLGGVKVVSALYRESLGAATYIPPEGMLAARPKLATRVQPAYTADPQVLKRQDLERKAIEQQAFDDAVRYIHEQVLTSGPNATNNWLHGHTIYAALTRRSINNWHDLGEAYPSSQTLRSRLTASVKGPETDWVLPYVNDLVSLLHPNPALRGDAAIILNRIVNKEPSIPAVDWDEIP